MARVRAQTAEETGWRMAAAVDWQEVQMGATRAGAARKGAPTVAVKVLVKVAKVAAGRTAPVVIQWAGGRAAERVTANREGEGRL